MTVAATLAVNTGSDPRGVLVGTADVPGGGRLHLFRHGQDYEILFGEEQLMGSWSYESEQQLATLALRRFGGHAGRVLIGGLGMGFTLAAARRRSCPTRPSSWRNSSLRSSRGRAGRWRTCSTTRSATRASLS